MANVKVNLRTLLLKPGRYQIQAKATGIGYRSSDFSNSVEYKVGFEITVNYTTGTFRGNNFIGEGQEGEIKLIANEGYDLPNERIITVTGADFRYSDGTIYLSNPVSDIVIDADGFEANTLVSYDLKSLIAQDDKKLKYTEENA